MKKNTGKNRKITDKFYTNNNVVDLCFTKLNKYETLLNKCKVIEPSAGSGAFLDKLSRQLILKPFEFKNNAKLVPTKPQPPVIKIFIF